MDDTNFLFYRIKCAVYADFTIERIGKANALTNVKKVSLNFKKKHVYEGSCSPKGEAVNLYKGNNWRREW